MGAVKIDDRDLALLLASGRTQKECASELGVSRVAVTNRVKKLRETNPWMLELTTVSKFREHESDMVAKARQAILDQILNMNPSKLKAMSLPQLTTAYGTLWDKDEKIQDRVRVKKIAVLHRHELDDESKKMLDALIQARTKQVIREARPEITVSGESGDETPLLDVTDE